MCLTSIKHSVLIMRMVVTCFYLLILLWCSERGNSETTTAPFLEGKRNFSTMSPKETTENLLEIESNGSVTVRINYTGATSSNNNGSAKTENTLIGTTTATFENSTDEDDSDADNVHSSFNLALIPAAAVFVLMIFICFKCCKWFRKYTRGGNKDVNYYAVILTDDDIGHIPIDTISSNTSLLKGCDNENKPSSYRDTRKESKNKVRIVDEQAVKYDKNEPTKSTPNDVFCFSNSSSADAILDKKEPMCSDLKRSDKLSVSFSNGKQLCDFQSRGSPSLTKQPNNVRCSVRKSATELSGSPVKPVKVMTNDAGTQTNKSFRYSLRTSKRLKSESGMNKETNNGLIGESIDKEQENNITSNIPIMPSNVTSAEGTNNSNKNLVDISKYPIDTNVELIERIKETNAEIDNESDLVDDVFVDVTKRNPIQNDDDLNVDLTRVVETCENEKSEEDHGITKSFAQPLTLLCTICNKNYCQAIKERICDIDDVPLPDDISSTQTICQECKLIEEKTKTDLCQTDDAAVTERTMTPQCDFTNVNDRPISSSSLESSGYAELSSSEYSSGSH